MVNTPAAPRSTAAATQQHQNQNHRGAIYKPEWDPVPTLAPAGHHDLHRHKKANSELRIICQKERPGFGPENPGLPVGMLSKVDGSSVTESPV
jgi:hypothetical protein